MATEHDDVEVEGTVEGSSAKAILFRGDFWDEASWLPRSQIEIVEQPDEPGRAIVYIRRWLCKKNGWM